MKEKFKLPLLGFLIVVLMVLFVYGSGQVTLNRTGSTDVETTTGNVYVCIIYSGGEIVFLEKSTKDNTSSFVGYSVPLAKTAGYGGLELVKRKYKTGDSQLELMVDYDAAVEVISYKEKLEIHLKNKR